MGDPLRIFGLLLYKNLLTRKKHWIKILIFRVILPLAVMIGMKAIRDSVEFPNAHDYDHEVPFRDAEDTRRNLSDWVHQMQFSTLYFFPNYSHTKIVMDSVKSCLQIMDSRVVGFETETEADVAYMRKRNSNMDFWMVDFMKYNGESTKDIKYKIKHSFKVSHKLFKDGKVSTVPYEYTGFVALQMCLERSLIYTRDLKSPFKEVTVQEFKAPDPTNRNTTIPEIMRYSVSFVVGFILFFATNSEIAYPTQEKLTGINFLMAMNGVKLYQNLLSWLVTGVIFSNFYVIPFIISTEYSFFPSRSKAYWEGGNPFILWLFFMIHIGHVISFGMHISSYFTRHVFTRMATIGLYIIPMMFGVPQVPLGMNSPLGILLPSVLLQKFFRESDVLELRSKGITWNTLFISQEQPHKLTESAGFALLFSVFGIAIHLILAVYVNAINPGKYGVREHPLYFIQWMRKKGIPYQDVENSEDESENIENFERVPDNTFTLGIEIQKLEKTYSTDLLGITKIHALKSISIDFYKGEITALLGHNGAGKSTLMSILTGVISETKGNVFIDGKSIKDHGPLERDIGLCPQESVYFSDLTVFEQMKLFGMLKRGNNTDSRALSEHVNILLKKLRINDKANTYPDKLSGGQKRKLCLGMAFIGDGSTLILDEPTSGMDPETRRDTWDLIMEMRGKKTTLISTHNIEEADIIGDRIAIMHGGRMKAFGTPMYLKKKQGHGFMEVVLSTEVGRDLSKIKSSLPPGTQELSITEDKMILNVPQTDSLPDFLDMIEQQKKDFGITGINASLITLEDTFLNIIKKDEKTTDSDDLVETPSNKLQGFPLWRQRFWGLLIKKLIYSKKQLSMLFILFILPLILQLIVLGVTRKSDGSNVLTLTPEMYKFSKFLYSSSADNTYGEKYAALVNRFGGTPKRVVNVTEDLATERRRMSKIDYRNTFVIAAKFDSITLNGLYSSSAVHSIPLTINMISNTLIKSVTGDDGYSIELSIQELPSPNEDDSKSLGYPLLQAFVLGSYFLWTVSVFVTFPVNERVTQIKQLQRMAGVDTFTYWGSMFAIDFLTSLVSIAFLMLEIYIFNAIHGETRFQSKELGELFSIIFLFGINNILIAYILSFADGSRQTFINLLGIIPFIALIAKIILILLLNQDHELTRDILIGALRLIPHNNLAFTFSDFYANPLFLKEMPPDLSLVIYLKKSYKDDLIFLGLTPLLYLLILICLEERFHLILMSHVIGPRKPSSSNTTDELVKREKGLILEEVSKISVMSGAQNSSGIVRNNNLFMASGLSKYYGDLWAVREVDFRVGQGECFGLLGVNGAGKSTTFKMLTGEVIPNTGTMYLKGVPADVNFQEYLSQLGYCPQTHALIDTLNAFEHLYLFARIRGIPQEKIASEVDTWIDRLNLHACKTQSSGTYSGGNKRRLNIAMALIGNPVLLLLDEPTTGVDPAARRSLWKVIQHCQKFGQAVILTSHSMEECEVVCNRLVIMVRGEFVCVGASQELKQRFGVGYNISIKLNPTRTETDLTNIKHRLLNELNGEIIDENLGSITYRATGFGSTWKKMYSTMNRLKQEYRGIEDFTIGSATLEQLFIQFARSAENLGPRVVLNLPVSEIGS